VMSTPGGPKYLSQAPILKNRKLGVRTFKKEVMSQKEKKEASLLEEASKKRTENRKCPDAAKMVRFSLIGSTWFEGRDGKQEREENRKEFSPWFGHLGKGIPKKNK